MENTVSRSRKTYSVAMLIREVYSLSMGSIDRSIADYGITPQQMMIIKKIVHDGFAQNTQLCRELKLSKGTVSGIVKRLVGKGLIRRETVEEDRRFERLVFTEEGRRFADSIRRTMQSSFDNLFENASDGQLDEYLKTLRGLAETLREAKNRAE